MDLIIDQGTSSTKVFLIDDDRNIRFSSRLPHQLQRPYPKHVESDPLVILEACFHLIKEAFEQAQRSGWEITSAGLAAQRSTFLFWDKTTARPLTPAISWQDTRAEVETKRFEGQAELIREKTGTPLSAHFGGPKYRHLLVQYPELQHLVATDSVYFGPLSAFLTQSFTGQPAVDHTIAGRSLFMNLENLEWDAELCALFEISTGTLPELLPAVADFGEISIDQFSIPLRCVIGDQQAALIGQGGLEPGDLALNYGTSGSVLLNVGPTPNKIPGLISSVLHSNSSGATYMLEGTINTCKSLFDWLEHDLNISIHRRKWDQICQQTTTNGVLVPGYSGLAAPYWCDHLETVMAGLDRNDNDQIVRAAVESIGFFTNDILTLIRQHLDLDLHQISASGGLSRAALLQFVANLLQRPVAHAQMKDHTALGVHQLLLQDDGKTSAETDFDRIYRPNMPEDIRQVKIQRWQAGLRQAGIEPVE